MKHWVWWLGAIYIGIYIVAGFAVHYSWHNNGCSICNRYGDTCPCGYLDPSAFMEWMDEGFLTSSGTMCAQSVTFIIGLPIFILVVVALTHILNPLHRKYCLAAILSGASTED